MDTYRLHYTSADEPGENAPWSVYVEEYTSERAEEPIEGRTRRLSTHATEAEADAEANRLQSAINRPA